MQGKLTQIFVCSHFPRISSHLRGAHPIAAQFWGVPLIVLQIPAGNGKYARQAFYHGRQIEVKYGHALQPGPRPVLPPNHIKGHHYQFAFLLCAPTFEDGATTIDAFVVTVSNTADMAKAIIIPSDSLSSSSIHLVTAEFAKKLPKGISKGQSFSGKTTKAADIKPYSTINS